MSDVIIHRNHKYQSKYWKNGRWHYIYGLQDIYRKQGYKRTNHGDNLNQEYFKDSDRLLSRTRKITFNGDQKVTLRERGKLERATENLRYKTAPLQGKVRQTKKAANNVMSKISKQANKSTGSLKKSVNRGMKKVDNFLSKHMEVSTKITYTDKSGKRRTRYSNGRPVTFK